MAKPRILVVEDERTLAKALEYNLQRDGYETIFAHDGIEGLRKAQSLLPDVVLLDIMLPGMSGLDLLQELRASEETRDLPVILITARSEEMDQVEGFAKGADDYVTKPFHMKVLLQRVRTQLRRREEPPDASDRFEHLGITVDKVRHRALVHGEPLDLTPTEFRLLECLIRQPGRAFSRRELMDAAILEGSIVLERTIDVHIKTLRRKIGEPDLIETVRGLGYRFRESAAVPPT